MIYRAQFIVSSAEADQRLDAVVRAHFPFGADGEYPARPKTAGWW